MLASVLSLVAGQKKGKKKTKQKSVSYDVSLCLPFAVNREEEQDWIENVKATFLIMNSNPSYRPSLNPSVSLFMLFLSSGIFSLLLPYSSSP